MQPVKHTKMISGSKNKGPVDLSARDAFIVGKAQHFTPTEILVLMKREGFVPVARSRIYQILEREGVKPKG